MDIIRNFLQNIVLNKIKGILPLTSIQECYLSMTAGMKNWKFKKNEIQMEGNNRYSLEDKHIRFPFYLFLLQGVTFCIIELSSSEW